MQIISHRGYWIEEREKNQRIAFTRSFELGFGTETDIRDRAGEIVISHDPPSQDAVPLQELLKLADGYPVVLALNVKADGLGEKLREMMSTKSTATWFTFDMSVPELVRQIRAGIPAFTRVSDLEPDPVCYKDAAGVWVDGFNRDHDDIDQIRRFLDDDKRVCIVSSELHNRNQIPLWERIKAFGIAEHPGVMLCTDVPERAAVWFQTVG